MSSYVPKEIVNKTIIDITYSTDEDSEEVTSSTKRSTNTATTTAVVKVKSEPGVNAVSVNTSTQTEPNYASETVSEIKQTEKRREEKVRAQHINIKSSVSVDTIFLHLLLLQTCRHHLPQQTMIC